MQLPSHNWDANSVKYGLELVGSLRLEILQGLKCILDKYHGENHTLEYYDLICGSWLENFTHNIYCAWREVLDDGRAIELSAIPLIWSLEQANMLTMDLGWHQHIKGVVSHFLEGEPFEFWAVDKNYVCNLKTRGNRSVSNLLNSITKSKPKILMTAPYYKCDRVEFLSALWSWRSWIALDNLHYRIPYEGSINIDWRRNISQEFRHSSCSLSEIVIALIPLYIPFALLEGFKLLRSSVLSLPIHRPIGFFTATGLHTNLIFKLLAAEWRQEGTLLLCHQHGGGYGLESQLTTEAYEVRVSDRFYSWGWANKNPAVFNLSPAISFPHKKKYVNRILLVCSDIPAVPYRLTHTPLLEAVEYMHRETYNFLMRLSARVNLTIRPYPQDFGWGALEKIRLAAPTHKIDTMTSFNTLLVNSRAVIFNSLGTGWLETLGLNIPTLCFYDQEIYIFRSDANRLIQELHRVGILHETAAGAARFLTSLGDNMEIWWCSFEVQEARNNFVESYAKFSTDWKKEWAEEFQYVIESSKY